MGKRWRLILQSVCTSKCRHMTRMMQFPFVFGVDTSINRKNITIIPYHFISTLLNANFDFDVTVANDVAKCALSGKVMKESSYPEVSIFTNENERFIMKLYDLRITVKNFELMEVSTPKSEEKLPHDTFKSR